MKTLSLTTALLFTITLSFSQSFKHGGEYLNHITKQYTTLQKDMWDYTSAVAHKSARKIEKRRTELISSYASMNRKMQKLPDYQGDGSLKDSVINFLRIGEILLKHDYSKIIDMEAIAEQSYDLMEVYMNAKKAASDKLTNASKAMSLEQKAFAETYDIKLVEATDKLSKKMEIAGKVYDYYNPMYLIFFKSYKQEAYLMEAMKAGDINSVEQNKSALITYSEEGLAKLKNIKAFNGDGALKAACVNMLTFYKKEALESVPLKVDFLLKKENFEKIKKAFEAKKEKDRTQADVDQYNNAVNESNEAVNKSNQSTEQTNNSRTQILERWNKGVDSFLSRHIPKK